MKYAIIVSTKDIAGMNIREQFFERYGFEEEGEFEGQPVYALDDVRLYTIDIDTIFFEAVSDIEADVYIFATRHQSKSGQRTLSVHFTGNYDEPEFGGVAEKLSMAPASLGKKMLMILDAKAQGLPFDVTMEATHHGPHATTPLLFIEIGSEEEHWKNEEAGGIVAATIMEAVASPTVSRAAIGFGGTHYCAGFNKIQLQGDIGMSHICPKYHVMKLDEDLVQEMLDMTKEEVDVAILDWKGMNSDEREHVIKLLEELKVPWERAREYR